MDKLIQAMRDQERLFYREDILSKSALGQCKQLHRVKRNKAEEDLGIIYNLIMSVLV